jgi:dihydrofolate reductase
MESPVSIIVAMDCNRLIGKEGKLPWHLPADLRHFKHTTLGKPIIMGRKTFESIGKALPGRKNIVLTRDSGYKAPGCVMAESMEAAFAVAGQVEEIMVIGGATVFELVLPQAQKIHLTHIDAEFEGDTWFPEIDADAWTVRGKTVHAADDRNPYSYTFSTLDRL